MLRNPRVHLRLRGGDVGDEVREHHVAHAEAERGQIDFAVAHQAEQLVVAAAAGQGALVFAAVEDLKDDAGVIGETADDRVVDLDEAAESRASRSSRTDSVRPALCCG